jgi:hypothetical protein
MRGAARQRERGDGLRDELSDAAALVRLLDDEADLGKPMTFSPPSPGQVAAITSRARGS